MTGNAETVKKTVKKNKEENDEKLIQAEGEFLLRNKGDTIAFRF